MASAFYAYNLVYVGEQKKVESQKAAKKLLDFEAGDLSKIVVVGDGETFTLEKRGDEWLIVSPIKAKTDSSQLDELIKAVAEGRFYEKVASSDDLDRFGLDKPKWKFEFYTSDGGEPQRLAVGNLSPTAKLIYVTSSRHDGVVAMGAGFQYRVQKPMFSLRDKRLFDVGPDEIVKLELVRDDYRLAASKNETGAWQLVEPVKAMADGKKIKELIRKTVYLKAAGFPSGSVSEDVTGLDSAEQIRLWRSGIEKPFVLSLGRKSSKADFLWVRASGKGMTAKVDAGFLGSVPADALDLREMRIVPADDAFWREVKELTVTKGARIISLAKGESGGWEALQPSSFKPDGEKINELLSTLRGMKSVRFISGSKAVFKPADMKIELESGGQKASVAFVTGAKGKEIVGGSNFHDENFVVSKRDFGILEAGISGLEKRSSPAP